MNKMSTRLSSILLAVVMVLTLMPLSGMAAKATVFFDMQASDYYADAAAALAQLDVLDGYPDGTFGADKNVTRAEMAAIVCRMIEKENDAEDEKGATAFEDVSAYHWASGYINVASADGIINGDGNGKFRPEDSVKYEEAIKMVVCALGYAENIKVDPNDWSKAYLNLAEEKGISDALRGSKGKAASRGDIAVMAYNGLTADLVAPTPSLSAGTYKGTQIVKLNTTTENVDIYYTVDGSTPTINSIKYKNDVTIPQTSVLQAIAVKDGVLVSDVMRTEYNITARRSGSSSRPAASATYTVSFDLNYEGATGAPEAQTVKSGETANEPDVPTNGYYQFVGWFVDKNETDLDNYYDFSIPVESDIALFAKWIDMTDTDGDKLVDGLEELYGTDKMLIDTDSDALNDYIEIFTFGSNPLLQDSDNNGTNDGDEDFDSDGLSNLTEINSSTDPVDNDSDDDELLDGEEITLGTNPNEEDTDDDEVSDGKELELGTDPLTAQTTFSMNLSADNDGEGATASVQMNLSGDQVETLSIEPVENDTFFPEDMPGYMGQAYDFNVEGEFDSADISFEFDASELGPDADPVIYYFNEETQELEELPTTINGNVATTTVSHFSKYILVDRKVYQESFTWQDVWESDHNFTDIEIVFVVDDSGSMDWNDPSYERLAVARTLIDNLPTDSKIGLVRFDGGWPQTSALTPTLTTDKEEVKNYLTTEYFYNPGGTDMYNGIQKAFPLYESTEDTTLKMMIVLSDGETDDTYLHSTVIATANENNIRIYTVGLGSSTSYFNNYMKPLANNTGAAFYLASDATQLADIYKDISEKIDIETDSDEDGIPDYYEDNMIIFNGVKLSLDKNNPDTDGDGLLDGEEVVITKEYKDNNTKVKVTGRLVSGNPTKSDTDNDGYNDDEDGDWNVAYVTPVILLHGRGDNTNGCFGAKTDITSDVNSHYGSGSVDYTDAENHKITHPITKNLAKTLQNNGYKANYSLFAFNYPNQDMAKLNAEKLDAYITDLVKTARSGNKNDVASASGIFPTKDQSFYQFDLIGHSNGGLVSRFYVENLGGSAHIRKLITIDTPHYGSGIAYGSDVIDVADIVSAIPGVKVDCYPMDVDLNPSSTLYNGGKKKVFVSLIDIDRASYINNNQSPKLNGNSGLSTKYYAIGGYDVSGQADGWFKEEMDNIPENLWNTQFIFDFNLSLGTMDAFNESIIKGYKTIDKNIKLDLKDSSGDNVVNVRSQFGVKDKFGYIVEAVYFRKTSMTVDTVTGHSMGNHFHGETQKNPLTMNKVVDYLSE